MIIKIKTLTKKYNIYVGKNILNKASTYFNLERKVLIITDTNIPENYINEIKNQSKYPFIYKIKAGEKSKNINNYIKIQKYLIDNDFTRKDCIVALGGGVVGDLACFVASTFNRGIDFYNIPTSLLAMVDSSIGGKNAIDFNNIKNVVGTFYQPSGVLISQNTLKTLPIRQYYNGMCEILKMALTFDESLFNLIYENKDLDKIQNEIIIRSIKLKKEIIEKDTNENNIRKVLNFGHTFGHAFEILSNGKMYHGEAVSLGMVTLLNGDIKQKLLNLLSRYKINIDYKFDIKDVINLIKHDKKSSGDNIDLILVNKIGTYDIVNVPINKLGEYYGK